MPDAGVIKLLISLAAAVLKLASEMNDGKRHDVPKRLSAIWMQHRSAVLKADCDARARNRFKE
jgi:hypothetical protein